MPEGRRNRLERLKGARWAAVCSHTPMFISLEPLCLQTLGLGAPSSCSVSGCSVPLSWLVLSAVSCSGLLPAGERDGGTGCSAAWAAPCPLGLPCGTRQYSLHRFCGCEQAGRASRHGMGTRAAPAKPARGGNRGLSLRHSPLAGSEVAVAGKCCYPSTFESECLYWWWLDRLVGLVGNRGGVPA